MLVGDRTGMNDRGSRVYEQLLWRTSMLTRAFQRQQSLDLGHQPHAYSLPRIVQPTNRGCIVSTP